MYLDAAPATRSHPAPASSAAAAAMDDTRERIEARFTRLRFGMRAQPAVDAPRAFHVIHGATPHTAVEVPAGWMSLSVSLAGGLRAASRDTGWDMSPHRLLLWHEAVTLKASPRGSWMVLCATPATWRRMGADAQLMAGLMPEESAGSHPIFRLMLRIARTVRTGGAVDAFTMATLVATLHESQAHLQACLSRCTGRTEHNRRRMLLRLLHLRHVIRCNLHRSLDMCTMSQAANYSVWHLARAFRAVFGQTPVDYAIGERLRHALALVQRSALPFCSIAEATGFESQSSFSRAFRGFHGMTPTIARASAHQARRRG